MNVVERNEHESSIDADRVLYTSYKWYFKSWSLLRDLYAKGVWSPVFDVTGSGGCRCKLRFELVKMLETSPEKVYLKAEFVVKPNFCIIQSTVSYCDENSNIRIIAPKNHEKPRGQWPTQLELGLVAFDSRFIKNDILKLFIEFRTVETLKPSPISTDIFISCELRYEFRHLGDDVTFRFKNPTETLAAKKVVLVAKSPVFRAMFKNDMIETKEGNVDIQDIDYAVFKVFLDSMHNGKIAEIQNVVNELIGVADKYQVDDLIDTCKIYMTANLDETNVIKYLLTAHRLSYSTLEQKAIDFIKLKSHILESADNLNLLSKYPSLITRISSK